MANVLPMATRAKVIAALVDGCSIRTASRLTDVDRTTVMRLGANVGNGCALLHDRLVRDVRCSHVQLDEQWAFVGVKQGHIAPDDDDSQRGDQWTFIGMDIPHRLILSYRVGKRTGEVARQLVADVRARVIGKPMIASDGLRAYVDAVELAFGTDCDFGQLVKIYDGDETGREHAVRYKGAVKQPIRGKPALADISTSLIERQNLTGRMTVRRLTRKTNGFSKKLENHRAAVSLYVMWYNFVRVHESLRVTPAVEAGLADHVWTIPELIGAAFAAKPAPPAPPKLAPAPNPVQMTLPGFPLLRLVK